MLCGRLEWFHHFKELTDSRAQLEDVSFTDYIHILTQLETDGYQKAWKRCATDQRYHTHLMTKCPIST